MQKDKQMYDRAYKYLARKRKQTMHAMEHAATKPNNKKELQNLQNASDVLEFLLEMVTEVDG